MTHTNLVANELHSAGFKSQVFTKNMVLVSLTNRKPSKMEVLTALDQNFESINFSCQSTPQGVLVELV